MKLKKIIALLLCTTFCISILASCENVTENTSKGSSEVNEEEGVVTGLPETQEYGGANFVIAIPDEKLNLFSTEEDGEHIVKTAVEERNRLVTDKYSVIIEYKTVSAENMANEIKVAAEAGTQFADLLCLPGETMVSLVDQGLLYNILSSDSFDINAGYIDTEDAKNTTVNNSLYMLYNSATQYYDESWLVFYDKKLIKDTGLTDPALLVESKEWTWEKFLEYSEYVAKNVMEKGSPDLATDIFGFGSYNNDTELPLAMWESCGLPMLGSTYLNEVKIAEDLTKVNETVNALETVYTSKSRYSLNEENAEKAFKEGRLAFYINKLDYASTLTNAIKADEGGYYREWGLLPLPKLEKSQPNYNTFIDSEAYAFAIPFNVANPKKSITILNAFCAASGDAIKDAVYDKYVNLFLQNNTSTVLLKNILDTGYFDVAALYGSRMDILAASTTKLIISAITENGALERPISDKNGSFTKFTKEKFK